MKTASKRQSTADSKAFDVLKAFQKGLAAGLNPDFSGRPLAPEDIDDDRKSVTSLRSRWLFQRCRVCGHTFRPGDEVRISRNGQVLHDMPGLRCASEKPASEIPGDPEIRTDFFAGLETAWPMPADVPVTRLEGDHYLLAPPLQGHGRASCRICGHTFRPYDHVVICPCSPENPRCQAAVHRDLFRHLHCWDEWTRMGKGDICLGMS